MKFLLVSFFISLLFTSYGKSLYYAYQNGEDYYSLEVTPRNEEIYRAKAASYNNEYIYIYIANFTDIRNNMIELYENKKKFTFMPFRKIYYLSKNKILKCLLIKDIGELDEKKLYFDVKQDSLIAEDRDVNFDFSYYEKGDFFRGDEKSCIKNYNKNFLPPFMVKADKIDFDKLQTRNYTKRELKYPNKVKQKNK